MTTVNPLGSWGKEYNDYNQNRLLLEAYAEVKFTDWLKAKTIISNDWINQRPLCMVLRTPQLLRLFRCRRFHL